MKKVKINSFLPSRGNGQMTPFGASHVAGVFSSRVFSREKEQLGTGT